MVLHFTGDEITAAERAPMPIASVGAVLFIVVLLAFAVRWVIWLWRRANRPGRSAHRLRAPPPPNAVHSQRGESTEPTVHGARIELSPTPIEILLKEPTRAPAPRIQNAVRPPPLPRAEFKAPVAPTKAPPTAARSAPTPAKPASPVARSSAASDQQAAARTLSHAEWAEAMRAQIRRSARGP